MFSNKPSIPTAPLPMPECAPSSQGILELTYNPYSKWFWVMGAVLFVLIVSICGVAYYMYDRLFAKHTQDKHQKMEHAKESSTDYLKVFWQQDDDLQQFVNSGLYTKLVVMVFHPGCGFCKQMKSTYDDFAKTSSNITAIKVFPSNFASLPGLFGMDAKNFEGVPMIFSFEKSKDGTKLSKVYDHRPSEYVTPDMPFRTEASLKVFADMPIEVPTAKDHGDKVDVDPIPEEPDSDQNKSTQESATPKVEPEPATEPATEPAPAPTPATKPAPAPTPATEPAPAPMPATEPAPAPTPATEPEPEPEVATFIAAGEFQGVKPGYIYKYDNLGLGYYKE